MKYGNNNTFFSFINTKFINYWWKNPRLLLPMFQYLEARLEKQQRLDVARFNIMGAQLWGGAIGRTAVRETDAF